MRGSATATAAAATVTTIGDISAVGIAVAGAVVNRGIG